jgi:HSP20 family protein
MADQQVTQSSGNRSVARRSDALSPFAPLREIERLFGDFFSVFGVPAPAERESVPLPAGIIAPRIDVSETDNEIRIMAELPGLNENDVDVRLIDDVLTIRGEAQTEHEEKQQDYRVMERARGTFVRSLRLPFGVDANQVQASFKDGILTITIPKPREERERVQQVQVTRDQSGNGSSGKGSQAQGNQTSGNQTSGNQAGDNQGASSGAQSSAEKKVSETAAE